MRVRVWVTVVLFVPLSVLAVANWSALRTPVAVDLFFFSVNWPLWPFVMAVPLLLTAVYLGAALLDRARQLRQVASLERQLEEARKALDRGREAALDALAERFEARIAGLESVVEGSANGLETRLRERLSGIDAHLGRAEAEQRSRLEAVAARVAAVRDELAADVGEAEDALLRALRALAPDAEEGASEEGAEPDDDVRPALPDGRQP